MDWYARYASRSRGKPRVYTLKSRHRSTNATPTSLGPRHVSVSTSAYEICAAPPTVSDPPPLCVSLSLCACCANPHTRTQMSLSGAAKSSWTRAMLIVPTTRCVPCTTVTSPTCSSPHKASQGPAPPPCPHPAAHRRTKNPLVVVLPTRDPSAPAGCHVFFLLLDVQGHVGGPRGGRDTNSGAGEGVCTDTHPHRPGRPHSSHPPSMARERRRRPWSAGCGRPADHATSHSGTNQATRAASTGQALDALEGTPEQFGAAVSDQDTQRAAIPPARIVAQNRKKERERKEREASIKARLVKGPRTKAKRHTGDTKPRGTQPHSLAQVEVSFFF
jgi:hypothetical protein